MTVNYLLDALYPSAAPVPPVGIIDLGGGSVQLVFASSTGKGLKHMDFGGRGHDTYLHSHLEPGTLTVTLTLTVTATPTPTPTLTPSRCAGAMLTLPLTLSAGVPGL